MDALDLILTGAFGVVVYNKFIKKDASTSVSANDTPANPGITVAGISWDNSFTTDFYDRDEAINIAQQRGQVLPTMAQLKSLFTSPFRHIAEGVLFANTASDLNNVDKCLFLPFIGNEKRKDGSSTDLKGDWISLWTPNLMAANHQPQRAIFKPEGAYYQIGQTWSSDANANGLRAFLLVNPKVGESMKIDNVEFDPIEGNNTNKY